MACAKAEVRRKGTSRPNIKREKLRRKNSGGAKKKQHKEKTTVITSRNKKIC